jgi:hypothetical protein
MELGANNVDKPNEKPVKSLGKPLLASRRRSHVATKVKPFNRDQIDKRTNAYKMFTALYAAVESDVGGADQISAVTQQLIEAFCIISVQLNDMSARSLAGQNINISLADISLAASTLTRLASRIGLRRVPRTLDQYLEKRSAISSHDIAERLERLNAKS